MARKWGLNKSKSNWYNSLGITFALADSHSRQIRKITSELYIIENQGSQTERRKYKSQHAMEAMKWMTVQLTWQREDGNLSEIAAWLLRFDRSVELISSHNLLEKRFQSRSEGMELACIYTSLCACICVWALVWELITEQGAQKSR